MRAVASPGAAAQRLLLRAIAAGVISVVHEQARAAKNPPRGKLNFRLLHKAAA